MKVDHKIKNIKNVFLSCKLWFMMEHFLSWVFYVQACTYFLCPNCGLHSLKVLQKMMFTSLCMYYVKQNSKKTNELIKEKCNIEFNVLPNSITFDLIFFFDNLIKFYTPHQYYITKAIWHQPIYTFIKYALDDINIYFSKNEEKLSI
jgi:hypothetical protein